MTTYYPVFLDLRGRLCLVAGGGLVAQRKVESLLAAGARVRVVSPELTDKLAKAAASGKIEHSAAEYSAKELDGACLVIGATSSPETNAQIHRDCLERGIPVNIVDAPKLCTFILPAVLRRGPLSIAISTGGTSPAWAAKIRRSLEKQFGEEYATLLEVIGKWRKIINSEITDPVRRGEILSFLADDELLMLLKSRGKEALEARIGEIVGGKR